MASTFPIRGWTLDVDTFKTRVNNFLDHSNLGESNMFFPIAVDGALVRGWEIDAPLSRSRPLRPVPSRLLKPDRGAARQHHRRLHLLPIPPTRLRSRPRLFGPVDHDQRHTLNTGFTANLPAHTWFATNVYYGSGFTNGLAGSGLGP